MFGLKSLGFTGILWVAKELDDVLGEMLFDLSVPRHRLQSARGGIAVPVVLATVPDKDTAETFDCSEKVSSLHATSSWSTLRTPGNSPLVKSR